MKINISEKKILGGKIYSGFIDFSFDEIKKSFRDISRQVIKEVVKEYMENYYEKESIKKDVEKEIRGLTKNDVIELLKGKL